MDSIEIVSGISLNDTLIIDNINVSFYTGLITFRVNEAFSNDISIYCTQNKNKYEVNKKQIIESRIIRKMIYRIKMYLIKHKFLKIINN